MASRSTRTYAVMVVSLSTYSEVFAKLQAADYFQAIGPDGMLDMHGIGLKAEALPAPIQLPTEFDVPGIPAAGRAGDVRWPPGSSPRGSGDTRLRVREILKAANIHEHCDHEGAHGTPSCTASALYLDEHLRQVEVTHEAVEATRTFDVMIGKLDRLLSEFLIEAARGPHLDLADWQTLKHHADDLIGVGEAALKRLAAPK